MLISIQANSVKLIFIQRITKHVSKLIELFTSYTDWFAYFFGLQRHQPRENKKYDSSFLLDFVWPHDSTENKQCIVHFQFQA